MKLCEHMGSRLQGTDLACQWDEDSAECRPNCEFKTFEATCKLNEPDCGWDGQRCVRRGLPTTPTSTPTTTAGVFIPERLESVVPLGVRRL